jgi:hypothetical protein
VIKSRRVRWAGNVAFTRERSGACRIDPRKGDHLQDIGVWKDNIKMNLQKVGWGCTNWIDLAHDRDRWRALVSVVMNLRVPYYS